MSRYLTPGVYYEWVDEGQKAIAPIRTDIAAFAGIAQRGPLQTPTRVISWQQFQSIFGGFIPNGYLAYAAKMFFENGGRECYILRVAAPLAQTSSQGPQPSPAQTSVLSADGFAAGGVVSAAQTRATQTAILPQPSAAFSVVNDVRGFPQGALVKISQAALVTYRRVKAVDAAPANRLFWDAPLSAEFALNQMMTFEAAHQVELMLDGVSGQTLEWQTPLPDYFDLTQPIEFATGAALAQAQMFGQDNLPALTIRAANEGAWGNHLRVRVTRMGGAATRSQAQAQWASVSQVMSVAGFLVGAVVKISQPDASAPPKMVMEHRAVKRVDAATKRIEWDDPLGAGFDLNAAQTGARPLVFEVAEFGLSVYEDGQLREQFDHLTLAPNPDRKNTNQFFTPDDERRAQRKYHAEKIVNGASSLIRIFDERWDDATGRGPLPDMLPSPAAANLQNGKLVLRGGRDGIAAIRPIDFTGDESEPSKRGLRALEDVDAVAILAAPDISIRPAMPPRFDHPAPPKPDPCFPNCLLPAEADAPEPQVIELAPNFSLEQVARLQQALIDHCEKMRDRIALLDPPPIATPGNGPDAGEIEGWRRRFETKYAALYYPWLLVLDPIRATGNALRPVPPCGAVAGIFARSDGAYGVHKAPANEDVRWAQAGLREVSANEQGALNAAGVNCIRTLSGRGLFVYGARTLSSDPDWRFVNVRRLMMMIEEALETALQWAVFEPNNLDLRRALITGISSFLEWIWEKGGLAGKVADEAFFVKCDDENNPPDLADAGQLIVDVGVAPSRPAEFVIVRIGKTADSLDMTEIL